MTLISVAAVLVIAAVALVLLLEVVASGPVLVVALLLGLEILDTAVNLPFVHVGSVSVYLGDALFALVTLAAFARLLGTSKLVGAQVAIIVAGLLACLAVLRGIAVVGLEPAVNEARPSFYFLAGVCYFMTVRAEPPVFDRISRLFLISAGILSLLVVSLWTVTLSGSPVPTPLITPVELGSFRVIGAGQAMLLTEALLIAIPGITGKARVNPLGQLRYLAFVIFPILILLQHRTVWVATAAGLFVLMVRQGSTARSGVIRLVGAAALVLLMAGLLFAGGSDNPLTQSFRGSANTHTLDWRYEGWVVLLNGANAPQGMEVFIGAPYGEGYARTVFGIPESVAPHNYYVEAYLRHGLVGLGALLLAYGFAISALARRDRQANSYGLANPDVLLALATSQLVFFLTYGPSLDQSAIAGLIVGAAASAKLTRPRVIISRDSGSSRAGSDAVVARSGPGV